MKGFHMSGNISGYLKTLLLTAACLLLTAIPLSANGVDRVVAHNILDNRTAIVLHNGTWHYKLNIKFYPEAIASDSA